MSQRPCTVLSRWDVARQTRTCHGCRGTIGEGEAVRLVGPACWPFCAVCTKQRFHLEPPAEMPAPGDFGDAMARMREKAGFSPVAVAVRDFKIAQMAREPGEDDVP